MFDPVKNLIPGQAQKELSYISRVNPAVYNNHSDTNFVTTSQPWDTEYVGKTWWDLSTVRYYEYENYDLDYRKNYWGKVTPGSSIDVYEWVESTELPSSYAGDGTVLNTTDYTSVTTVDKQPFLTFPLGMASLTDITIGSRIELLFQLSNIDHYQQHRYQD